MGSDAVSALIWGRLFDRIGLRTLVIVIGVSAWFAPLVFLGQTHWALLGMILWGIGTGAQESIFKAAVATLIPSHNRGIAFGIYYLGFGLAWFLGSTAMGVFYDVSLWGLVAFSLVLQLTGIPIFWIIKTKTT
jgi:MFS family permease